MLKNKIILAVIAVIIALGLAGCRAEKDNISSVPVNTESSITETVSDISETPADASSNKTAEITESSAPAESRNDNKLTEGTMQNNGEPKKTEKPKTPTEPETRKTESEKPPAPTESVSKPEEIQIPSESSVPEKQEPEFNIDYYIKLAQEYAVKSGLKLDQQAKYCCDNPIAAGKSCRYTERDIKWYIDKYAKAPEITVVWIWAEENGKDYEIYIGYA